MYVLTCANFKGGTGKSTTAGLIAHALQRMGFRVALADTDPAQASVYHWAKRARADGWSIPVHRLDKVSKIRDIAGYVDVEATDVLVVDTPPLELQREITETVFRFTDYALVPLRPSFGEFETLAQMWPAMKAGGLSGDEISVFFVAAKGKIALETYRTQLEAAGHHVLNVVVPDLDRYRQVMQGAVTMSSADYYYMAAERVLARTEWEPEAA